MDVGSALGTLPEALAEEAPHPKCSCVCPGGSHFLPSGERSLPSTPSGCQGHGAVADPPVVAMGTPGSRHCAALEREGTSWLVAFGATEDLRVFSHICLFMRALAAVLELDVPAKCSPRAVSCHRTIEKSGRKGPPEVISSHPAPCLRQDHYANHPITNDKHMFSRILRAPRT